MDQRLAFEDILRQMALHRYQHESQDDMIDELVTDGNLSSDVCIRAFQALDRKAFLSKDCFDAYTDSPVRDGKLHQSAPSIYAKALEALELTPGLSFLNIGSGTGYFSALVAQIIGASAVNIGVECHEELVELARRNCAAAGLPDIHFQCGDCFCIDVDKSMKFDRIYIGAGAPRNARFLFKLLKYDGIVVGPFEDEKGGPQGLTKARCRGGKKYAVSQLLPVQFADLVQREASIHAPPVVLAGPRWDMSKRSFFPERFKSAVIMLYWMHMIEGSLPNKLPWEVWTKYIIAFLPVDAFNPEPKEVTCASCNACLPTTQCGRCRKVFYCGRACQRSHWNIHKSTCMASASSISKAGED